jgi:hypothetical protein
MRFWLREIVGWLFVILGLFTFYLCWELLNRQLPDPDGRYSPAPALIEVGPLAFIGFIIFRGGIHLLKVAVAARICLYTQDQLARDAEKQMRRQPDRQTRKPGLAARPGAERQVSRRA